MIFVQGMYKTLRSRMAAHGWDVEVVDSYWQTEYKDRCIVSQFLKDKLIGAKRLTSMPDRFTNTINDAYGEKVFTSPPDEQCKHVRHGFA